MCIYVILQWNFKKIRSMEFGTNKRLGSKDIEQKQQEKICTEQKNPERSSTVFQVLPHPEPHRTCFFSSIQPKRHVQESPVWVTRSKTFMKSWSHRRILLYNQLWQLKLRTQHWNQVHITSLEVCAKQSEYTGVSARLFPVYIAKTSIINKKTFVWSHSQWLAKGQL